MNGIIEHIGLALCLFGLGAAFGRGVWPAILLLLIGLAVGPLREGLLAVFAPFGVMLPALALGRGLAMWGHAPMPWRSGDLIVVLVLYLAFLVASLDGVGINPYGWGYTPLGAAIAGVALAALALWRGRWCVAAAVPVAQGLWLAEIGPENFFDLVSHALLVPVVGIVLLRRGCCAIRSRMARNNHP